ncbi:SDR family oxidoreductase, partial [Barnesiella intestinihominis]
IRTAWLYSPYGNNFVKTMLHLGEEREELSVVADQIGTPTCAADLAQAILVILQADTFVPGTYHFSDEGVCSWYDFTVTIHRLAGITTCRVTPIRSDEYPSKAHRPFYSVLDKSKIKKTYGLTIPHWYESLSNCIKLLQETH